MIRSRSYLFVGVLPWVALGCGPSARLRVEQPGFQGLQRSMHLISRWAAFDRQGSVSKYVLSFPLPGAVSGDKHYHLYLQSDGDRGDFASGQESPQARRFRGFFVQVKGAGAGLAEVSSGHLRVKPVAFGGPKVRRMEVEAVCDDGTQVTGTVVVRQDPLAVERFEDRYAADVRNLAGSQTKPAK